MDHGPHVGPGGRSAGVRLGAGRKGYLQAAAEQVEAAHRTWEQHRGISASLVDHQRLEDIDQGFTDLQAWFQLGEEAEFAQSCLALAQQVRAMADAEKPYYYNIL